PARRLLALSGSPVGLAATRTRRARRGGSTVSPRGLGGDTEEKRLAEAPGVNAPPPEVRRRTCMSTQSPTWPKAIPGWLNATLICGTFATLLWLEHRRPLRRQTERKLTRNMRNLAMVGLSATTIWLTERPVASALAQFVEREQWGLVQCLRLPPMLK